MYVTGMNMQEAVCYNNLGTISLYPGAADFRAFECFLVSIRVTGVNFMEEIVRLRKYCA